MNSRTRKYTCVCFLVALLGAMAANAQTKATSPVQKLDIPQGSCDFGLIFNTSSILLGLESYQGGLGLKVGRDRMSFRGLFALVLNGASDAYSLNPGAAIQYYLITGSRIAPYIGGSATGGYMRPDNVTSIVLMSVGALAGVEVFLFDFLSVFAEYAITADFTLSTDIPTSQTTFDYLVDAGLGNDSKLGIVIYFVRAAARKK